MGAFTPLTQLPAPRVVSSSDSYPGDGYKISHFFDSRPQTEYACNGNGTGTIVEMQFAEAARAGAFRHVDRNDPATVAASELVFLDAQRRTTATIAVPHVNKPAGVTFFVSPILSPRNASAGASLWRRASSTPRFGYEWPMILIKSLRAQQYPAPLGSTISDADKQELREWWGEYREKKRLGPGDLPG
ncbi:MAG: hypothetical protein NTU53_04340 [Planctomycetota bacterium]|nr:hypothetical protein [Planctomycetota bacterium]